MPTMQGLEQWCQGGELRQRGSGGTHRTPMPEIEDDIQDGKQQLINHGLLVQMREQSEMSLTEMDTDLHHSHLSSHVNHGRVKLAKCSCCTFGGN